MRIYTHNLISLFDNQVMNFLVIIHQFFFRLEG